MMSRRTEPAPLAAHSARAITAVVVLCSLAGCVSTSLEFDRMTGTAFPTAQTLDGQSWDLKKIYANATVIVSVNEDDTNIAPLTNSAGAAKTCISDAELDSLMSANRSSQTGPATFACGIGRRYSCTRYHAYGIVVNHNGMSDGACSTTLLGRMWDTTQRSAFAVFYKNSTISSNGKKYLRTTAHELGHAFNLHHQDGDGESTIMNQTAVVGDSFNYEFEDNSKVHLQQHPANCRFPGTGTFGADVADHDSWHDGITSGCTP